MLRNEISVPAWALGHTAQSWDRMPSDILKQCEVTGGSIRFGWPLDREHNMAVSAVWAALRRPTARFAATADRNIRALLGMDLRIEDDPLHQCRPDVVVARNATLDAVVVPGEVLLAVEVTAIDSGIIDKIHKRDLYAWAGIPHYWIIETRNGAVSTVTWYALPDDDKRYEVRACWTPAEAPDGIRAEEPFPIRIAWDELAF